MKIYMVSLLHRATIKKAGKTASGYTIKLQMTDVKLNTDLSMDANDSDDAAERSINVGLSETDLRSCSSTTSACSISYKHRL